MDVTLLSVKIVVFPGELEDPIGKPLEAYERCAGRIKQWVEPRIRTYVPVTS